MPLHWTLGGPASPPGVIYTALLQTSIAFTGGLGVAQSAAFVLYNPPLGPSNPSGMRIVPLIAHGAFIGTATTPAVPVWGIAKLNNVSLGSSTGTSTFGLAAASTLIMVSQVGKSGRGTGVAVFVGSATITNGTAGGAADFTNMLNFVTICGGLPCGPPLGTAVIQGTTRTYLDGDVSILPGEIALVQPGIAIVGIVGLTYAEVSGPYGGALSFA